MCVYGLLTRDLLTLGKLGSLTTSFTLRQPIPGFELERFSSGSVILSTCAYTEAMLLTEFAPNTAAVGLPHVQSGC